MSQTDNINIENSLNILYGNFKAEDFDKKFQELLGEDEKENPSE